MSEKRAGIGRFQVVMEDGAEWVVAIKQRDQIEWEDFAAPKNWEQTKRPGRWAAYVSWRASRRDGHVPKTMTWDQWSEALDYAITAEDEDESEPLEDEAAPFPAGDDPSSDS